MLNQEETNAFSEEFSERLPDDMRYITVLFEVAGKDLANKTMNIKVHSVHSNLPVGFGTVAMQYAIASFFKDYEKREIEKN